MKESESERNPKLLSQPTLTNGNGSVSYRSFNEKGDQSRKVGNFRDILMFHGACLQNFLQK